MEPKHLIDGAREVARRLTEAGHEAYFAGGCVRDLLLGSEPRDFDIATNARPDEVKKLFRRRVEVGAAFGVVRVILDDGREYEIATYRTEGTYGDGRRPDHVEYSNSAEEDVHRRDFTINALLMDPVSDLILDHVGGRKDLELGVVRAVGDPHRRFQEDRLRMLRAVRFAARFGFEIDGETWVAMKAHAPELKVVSRERVATELHGMWVSSRPGRAMALLSASGLLVPALPFLESVEGQQIDRLEARLARLPELFLPDEDRLVVAWALHAELSNASPPRGWSERLVQEFKLSRAEARDVTRVLELSETLLHPDQVRLGRCRQILLSLDWARAFGFLRAREDEASSAVQWWREAERVLRESPPAFEARLAGADLQAMGMTPGPEFKVILESVELEVLEGRLRTKDESIAFAKRGGQS